MPGPRVRAALKPALLSATACGSRRRPTNSGTADCQAGPFMALPTPSAKVSSSRLQAVSWPIAASVARAAAQASIQSWQQIR